ncbi:MAG: 5'-methylthioadenosine/S-adenosylhomocysteine nucleosidase [Actinomycetaceae bacterium]|nr:5'-methylthioadenosine/S-adenosylhomocysteine nucleosidase [Actinomycetaceae bacterium]
MGFPQFQFESSEVTVIAAAMEMELAPFLEAVTVRQHAQVTNQDFHLGTWLGREVLLVRSGIGLVNGAVAATRALAFAAAAGVSVAGYLYVGTCGGLAVSSQVGQVVVGNAFIFSRADATAFGYAPGQVPGLPVVFPGDETLLPRLPELSAGTLEAKLPCLNIGVVASSDAFVTAANVEDTRERFPSAIAVDMESAAAAQVCHLSDVPFVSVRGISDLCGPAAGQDFHIDGEVAAQLSFLTVKTLWG